MDDTTIIERLARTLCRIRGIPADDHHMDYGTQWESVAREAKGLLISLKDPTEAMIHAGAEKADLPINTAEIVFRSMIDAAIAKQI